jgi:hypothetical protein
LKILYKLPESLREEMRRQIGRFFTDEEKAINYVKEKKGIIVSVGDKVTLTLYAYNIEPNICIIDFKTRRGICSEKEKKTLSTIGEKVFKAKNPPGALSEELWKSIEKSYKIVNKEKKCVRIEVDGEDDLAALPAIYLAPISTTIIYGMPDKGISLVEVTDENKKQVKIALEKMKI